MRSYADIAKRGHLAGTKIDAIAAALPGWEAKATSPAKEEVRGMVERLPDHAPRAQAAWKPVSAEAMPDYLELVGRHNPRHKKAKKKS